MNSTAPSSQLVSPTTHTWQILGNGIDPRVLQAKSTVAKFDIPLDPPNIKQPSEEFDFKNPQVDPIQFARDLVDTMVANMGLGLAAPQIGHNIRVIAIRGEPMLVMFNPKLVSTTGEERLMEEGCLSYNGIYLKVKRPPEIRVRYTQPNGETKTEKFQGLTARIIQHEIDHLEGITMFDRAHAIHREQGLRKLKQLKRRTK